MGKVRAHDVASPLSGSSEHDDGGWGVALGVVYRFTGLCGVENVAEEGRRDQHVPQCSSKGVYTTCRSPSNVLARNVRRS